MSTSSQKLGGITIPTASRSDIREKIITYAQKRTNFAQVVSLNPEIMVLATEDPIFLRVLTDAEVQIIDGVGVSMVAKLRGIPSGERYSGADLMHDLIKAASVHRFKIAFLGGAPGVAEKLVSCYSQQYPTVSFTGFYGSKDIKNDQDGAETDVILRWIREEKPHILFVSFGSPTQEKWIWQHRAQLTGIVCIGVGGAFDFAAGTVSRAPAWIRRVGGEWLYRLIRQPWRWRRQLRLVRFLWMGIWGR